MMQNEKACEKDPCHGKRVIGITGGSGCGKSYLSGLLRERGIPVIDADVVAHEVMEEGQPCLLEVAVCFGSEVLSQGKLNRKRLAEIVFSDEKKLKKLNEITHKYILESIYNKVKNEESKIVCVDGAVLIESGFGCDMMIGILADKGIRKSRIMLRDNLSEKEADARINAQKEDGFYLENCDFVVYNNSDTFDIDSILKRISE